MLRHLYIRNYALIEELDLELKDGFSVITGETGAGKSILLGAISLLTGQRADSQSIQEGATKCTIEATFDIDGYSLQPFFEENDFDYEADTCTIRRELTATGKSRAFINDSPATLSQLKELGQRLIDIHSQHQNLLLSDEDFQLNVLDIMAGNKQDLALYQQQYSVYRSLEKRLAEAIETAEKSRNEEDYLSFQLQQLQELAPLEGEDELLREEQNSLEHAEEIKATLYQLDSLFNGTYEAEGLINQFKQGQQMLQGIATFYPRADELAERIDSLYIELKDIASEVSSQAEDMEFNPQRFEEVNTRLDRYYTLEKKHGVESADELIALMHDIEAKLALITNADETIAALRKEKDEAYAQLEKHMLRLRKTRTDAVPQVEQHITESLLSLGIPNARFHVEIVPTSTPTPSGGDRVTFLFAANKNAALRPVADVASGGETSRLMLSLKAMTSAQAHLPTLIFDEIDTGVSGRIAESMALIMRKMSEPEKRQVIAITHLPQIAACGKTHYSVFKEDVELRTVSRIKELSDEERVMEIAHLLSGNDVTQAAIENAKQLLRQ